MVCLAPVAGVYQGTKYGILADLPHTTPFWLPHVVCYTPDNALKALDSISQGTFECPRWEWGSGPHLLLAPPSLLCAPLHQHYSAGFHVHYA